MRPHPAPLRCRPLSRLHLRRARPAEFADIAAFCDHHRPMFWLGERPYTEAHPRWRSPARTALVALRDRVLVGVALCHIANHRARLTDFVVCRGPDRHEVESRLLRRLLHNLRACGVATLDFGEQHAAPEPAVFVAPV